MPADRPNILVYMTDQQQGDVIHPDHPCKTPNIDRITSEGALFTQHYTSTAHCCPSRASFMTGLYPSRHGVHNNISNPVRLSQGLNDGVRCFSEDLSESGYGLSYAGKWHVSNVEDPIDRGWRELEVTCRKNSFHHATFERFDDIAQAQKADDERAPGQIWRPGWGHYKLYGARPDGGPKGYENHHDYKIVRSAMEALPEMAKGDQPWMLYCGPQGPHDPFIIPEKFANMYDPADIKLPENFFDTLEDKPHVYQKMRHMYWGQLTPDEVRASIAHYWGYCTMLDAMFGELLQVLESTGQMDNTIIIYTSDHGDYCGAHGIYCKGVPAFREAYNIPLAIRWANGMKETERVIDDFTCQSDMAQTFREIAGCEVPQDMPGRSILPFIAGDALSDWREEMHFQFNGVELYYSQRTCFTKKWKYVYNGFDFDELYDLENDPHEMVNLAAPCRNPQPMMHVGESATSHQFRPWPHLSPELEEVRKDMLQRIWRFNRREQDAQFNPYATVAMAPLGPGTAVMSDER